MNNSRMTDDIISYAQMQQTKTTCVQTSHLHRCGLFFRGQLHASNTYPIVMHCKDISSSHMSLRL